MAGLHSGRAGLPLDRPELRPATNRPAAVDPMNAQHNDTRMRSAAALNSLFVVVSICGFRPCDGADYADPPSWDPMLMLRVSFDANRNLVVESNSTIIRLQPAPGAYHPLTRTYDLARVSFDPAAAWSVLNGTAYSRVLGWYDEGTTGANGDNFYDTYAAELAGNYVWIEKMEGSAELKTYAVTEASDPTGPYTPIFGTEGSSTRWCWDGFMAHNAYAVPLTALVASNQIFTATYHLYVGDAAGNPVPGYGGATTTWTWQGPAIPFRPELRIQNRLVVEWPVGLASWVLEAADSGDPTTWIAVTNAPVVMDGNPVIILDPSVSTSQFRLRMVP